MHDNQPRIKATLRLDTEGTEILYIIHDAQVTLDALALHNVNLDIRSTLLFDLKNRNKIVSRLNNQTGGYIKIL